MESTQSELVERIQVELKGEILRLSVLYPRGNKLKEHPFQSFKAAYDPDTMYLHEAM